METPAPTEKEKEFLDMIFALEAEKQSIIDESRTRIGQLRKDFEDSKVDNEKLQKRVAQLEQQLAQSHALGGATGPKNKDEHEDLLVKAKGLLFEKTKLCKQQETTISCLREQIDSLKGVVDVTKEMLNLKSAEMEHMESRWETVNLRAKSEKDRSTIYQKKYEISQGVYDKLRTEYDTQKKIYGELKESYDLKIKALQNALEAAKK